VGAGLGELMVVRLLSLSLDSLVRWQLVGRLKQVLVVELLVQVPWCTWAGHPPGLFFKEECRILDLVFWDRKIWINRQTRKGWLPMAFLKASLLGRDC
jgi:hypothetical protein